MALIHKSCSRFRILLLALPQSRLPTPIRFLVLEKSLPQTSLWEGFLHLSLKIFFPFFFPWWLLAAQPIGCSNSYLAYLFFLLTYLALLMRLGFVCTQAPQCPESLSGAWVGSECLISDLLWSEWTDEGASVFVHCDAYCKVCASACRLCRAVFYDINSVRSND